jgi:fructoselysine-6-P-deglycase FrlB-like protein
MQLRLSDPSYTDRLATFLRSLGQAVLVAAPNQLEVDAPSSTATSEIEIYLRVWKVLYPDAEVFQGENGDEPGAA